MSQQPDDPDAELRLAMLDLIHREQEDGCCMAAESLIAPAIRRWRSYSRRNAKNKQRTQQHRKHDLNKGLLSLFPEHHYDPACVRHLAESFADILESFDTARERSGRADGEDH